MPAFDDISPNCLCLRATGYEAAGYVIKEDFQNPCDMPVSVIGESPCETL